ncbi:hypothetical protein B0H12DRAFT_538748 [Mycena haematopus]|nr:hypothetical protein B0H12DRAFT_538748 [Mycena haematopus]
MQNDLPSSSSLFLPFKPLTPKPKLSKLLQMSTVTSSVPHSAFPMTTCPLPTKATTVKRSKHVKKRNAAQRLPAGYAFVPPPVPLTYPKSYHLIDAGPMNVKKRMVSAPVTVAGLPAGYAFTPPSVPLTYPEGYHFIDAGPMNEVPKPKRKRTAFGALTNVAERVRIAKRKASSLTSNEGDRWEFI